MPWRCTERGVAQMLNRRDCLSGALSVALAGPLFAALPAAATELSSAAGADTGAADRALRAALDALLQAGVARVERAARTEPVVSIKQLATLAPFELATLSPGAAIDLATVRMALTVDFDLAAATAAGDAARSYALRIARQVGATVDAAALHRELQAEVNTLTGRADHLLRQFGLRQGSVGTRFAAFAARAEYLYDADEAGRDALVASMNDWLARARTWLPRQFTDVPGYCLRVQVERLSMADEAAGKPGNRRLPDAAKAGAYVIDLRDMARRPRWTLPSVVHHELLPGHLLQLPMEAAAGAHPLRLEFLRAWSEGWATYAEELAGNDGAYRHDPAAELGLLHWLLFRALRGLIDTGIHHESWSTDAALAQLQQIQGFPAYFAPFDDDLKRIVAEPGARAAESLVWMRLRALSARAARRGQRRAFHQLALRYGRLPLTWLANLHGVDGQALAGRQPLNSGKQAVFAAVASSS
jgi:Bacterial protein of unknown function (DUF885)